MIRLILQEAFAVARAIGSFNGVLDAAVAKGSETQTVLTMKGSDKGNNQKRQSERKKRQSERKKKKSTSNSSSKSKNKKRKSSSSSRSKKGKRSRGYGMCGRNMRSRDKRACDRLEREFCNSRRQIRQNRSLCYQLGFTRYYAELGTDLHEYENEDENEDNGCNCNDWDGDDEDEDENEDENENGDWGGDDEDEDEDGPDTFM